jgi:hypothetical protein
MEQTLFGLDGIPAGDPGFTVAIEIDHPLSTLSPVQRTALLNSTGSHVARLDRAPVGNARVVFDATHSGWWESGQTAVEIARSMEGRWPIAGIEICRSDLWIQEPFFDHEPDGLGELPHWCERTDQGHHATVIVEVEPARTPTGRRRSARTVLKSYHNRSDARVSQSTAKRPHLIVEVHGSVEHGAVMIAKPAHFVSNDWSITRIRSVRADIYRIETSDAASQSTISTTSQVPEWQFVSNAAQDRFVVVADPTADLTGWNVDFTTVDGAVQTSPFYLGTVRSDDNGTTNISDDGAVVTAWTAAIDPGAHLDAFTSDDCRLEVDPWDGMAAWLVESMYGQPLGLIIELGPNSYVPDDEEEDEDDVACAQIQVLDDGVFMLRRSRKVLGQLMLTDYSATGLRLDTWHHDDHFDDCTDGYLFSRDAQLIASTCITWFRDNTGVESSDELGCDYRFADDLPRFQ